MSTTPLMTQGDDMRAPTPAAGAPAGAPPADSIAGRPSDSGPLAFLTFLVILLVGNDAYLPLGAILALLWARWSRTPWRDFGFIRPKNWPGTVAIGILFGGSYKLALKSVVMPLLGADPVNHAYHFLAGNSAALPGAIYAMIVGAGFGEETVFRGYLFERSGRLFGRGRRAKALTVVGTSLVFGLGHYANQGITGAEQATIVGLVFGTVFAITGELWLLIIAHAAFDLTALAMIYWNLETRVAHFFFK